MRHTTLRRHRRACSRDPHQPGTGGPCFLGGRGKPRPSPFLAATIANTHRLPNGWTSLPALSNARSMNKTQFSVREILAGAAPKDVLVTVKGWVRTRRDSKAGISFVHLSDGSAFHPLQVVAPNTLANYTDDILKLTAGCALAATGTIVPSPAKGQPLEVEASAIG